MRSTATVLILATVLTLGPDCSAAEDAADRLQLRGSTMGTYYSVVIDSPGDVDEADLRQQIEQRLKQVNDQMSTWDSESEISKFNQSTSTDWFQVSTEFVTVVKEADRIFRLTDGYFDPTVAPLIDLWGFGDQRKRTVPADTAIRQALQQIGMDKLHVRLDPPALKKDLPELQLNLSAIAKGYGVDAIALLLQDNDLPSFIVDIGGETRAGSAKSSGAKWRLGVESIDGKGVSRILELASQSVATSGDYRNNFTVDGVRYSHAIDPTTGRPVQNPPASVSVVSDECMTADALATALMVMPKSQAEALAESEQLSIFLQYADDDDQSGNVATGMFLEASAPAATQKSSANWFPFVAAAVIFLVAVAGMAVGTMVQNRALKGSCGGLASMPGSEGKSICELCTIPKDECTNADLREQMQAAADRRTAEDAAETAATAVGD
ncbi:MAG: FAD:protein FMN transferase [Fuerstiella sp.]